MLAEEHPTIRAALKTTLEKGGFKVCAEAGAARGAVEAAQREHPDICLLAVHLPGGGIQAAAEITVGVQGTAVVMFTESVSRDHLFDSLRAGAVGYLLKDMDPQRIPHALHGVLNGEAAIPRALVASLVTEFQSQGHRRMIMGKSGRADLSARVWDVLELLRVGLTTKQIATRLHISPVTVRRHISSTLAKLGVADRDEALTLLEG